MNPTLRGFVLVFVILLLIAGLASLLMSKVPEEQSATPTPASISATATRSIILPDASPLRVSQIRSQDQMEMVYVPSGEFFMGSQPSNIYTETNEIPYHIVELDDFYIDKYEVTVGQFAQFLNVHGNQEEGGIPWVRIESEKTLLEVNSSGNYVPKEGFENYPIAEVSWYGANAYCESVGARLPTEAEWEYAARSPESLVFPWGGNFDGNLFNFCDFSCPFGYKIHEYDDGYETSAPVDAYPGGESWVGALSLAGNVGEWVNDWYSATYYQISPKENPFGPDDGTQKVVRGASWMAWFEHTRLYRRNALSPSARFDFVGFRCVSP